MSQEGSPLAQRATPSGTSSDPSVRPIKLSAVIITRDEERNIARCLRSVAFCDEVVVVDAESSDRTLEICREHTDRVYTQPWRGYAEQKNFAVGLARGEWVLSVDADEEVTPELRREIESLLAANCRLDALSVPRKTLHSGRWIRYGGWYPNRLVRLFRKARGRWEGPEVHERWLTDGEVGQLNEPLLHHSFDSFSDQVRRNDHYSTLGALALFKQGKRFSLPQLLFRPISKFLETYVLKRGFLDGYPGFVIAVSAAYSVFLKWAKLWELENERASAIPEASS